MKRPAGVTIAAVIALLGSVGAGFVAILGLVAAVFISRSSDAMKNLPQQGALPLAASVIGGALFEFGFAGWGLATGIGLIRLKPWSRISILIYSGLLAITAAFMVVIFMLLPLPATPNTPQNFNFIFRIGMEAFCAVLLFIAVWWLVLFTRKSVVAQLSDSSAMAAIPTVTALGGQAQTGDASTCLRRPLTITIIAWFFVASVPMMIFSLLINRAQGTPVPFFWTVLEGREVMIYLAFFASIMLIAGISLLRNRVWGFWLALGIQSYGLVSSASTLLLPGRAARWETLTESMQRSLPPEMRGQAGSFPASILAVALAGSCLFALVVLWLLWTRRKRFFDFVAMQSTSIPKA